VTTPTTVQVRLKLRRDTAANWTTANPVLLAGELGLESDTNKIKIGDGTTAWTSLGYFPFVVSGGVVTGNLEIGTTGTLTFEGSSADAFETTLGVINPTADRTINLPNVSGTIITTGDTGTVTSTMIADGTIVNADISASAEIAVSKLADGAARQLLQTDAAGTGVEWTSNVDLPGTLDVTGAATFDGAVTIAGDLTVNGTTTNINTQNLVVEDKNVILGDVATPTDVTADGGGITLKGATDKTITWSDTTDSWEFNQPTITTGSSTAASFIPTGSTVPSNGVYLSGTNTVAVATNSTGRLFVDASGNLDYYGNTIRSHRIGAGAFLNLRRAEGSQSSPTAITTGSTVGEILFQGYDGTTYNRIGTIVGVTDGAVSSTSSPGYIALYTTPGGSTTNQERLRITSDGKLGLGTSSPGYKLHVTNAADVDIVAESTSTGAALLRMAASTQALAAFNSVQSLYGSTESWSIGGNGSQNTIAFRIAGSEKARITSAGNVGIGTTAPSQKLHVAGNALLGGSPAGQWSTCTVAGDVAIQAAAPLLNFVNAAGSARFGYIIHDGTGGNIGILNQESAAITFGTNNSEKARIDSSGRLLVGTSGSYAVGAGGGAGLQVVSAFGASIRRTSDDASPTILSFGKARGSEGSFSAVQNGDYLGEIRFVGHDGSGFASAGAYITAAVDGAPSANDMPGRLVFSTTADGASSPTERMRVDSAGNVYVGTTTVSYPNPGLVLQPAGVLTIGNDAQASGWGFVTFSRSNTLIGSITQSGTTGVAYNTSSDYRLKENVVPLTGAADRLNQLQVHRFNFIADPGKTVDGFLAHEAQAVVPECVTGTKDEVDADGNPVYQGIDQSKLVPLLTAALQEALAEIESLKVRVTALEP
jgi:hypothetical protein